MRETIARVLRSYGLASRDAGASADVDGHAFTDADFDAATLVREGWGRHGWGRDGWRAVGSAGIRRIVVRQLPESRVDVPRADGLAVRAVIDAPRHADRQTLQSLHDQGVRGIRFALDNACDPYAILHAAERVVPLDWHVELVACGGRDRRRLSDIDWELMQIPVPTCFSGLTELCATKDTADAETAFLLELVQMGRFWLKLSGAEIAAATTSTRETLRRLVNAAMMVREDRLVWGSGPPSGDFRAHVAQALQTLCDWLPDAAGQRRVLWSNPSALYHF